MYCRPTSEIVTTSTMHAEPMTTPNMVRNALTLFARRESMATFQTSRTGIQFVSLHPFGVGSSPRSGDRKLARGTRFLRTPGKMDTLPTNFRYEAIAVLNRERDSYSARECH